MNDKEHLKLPNHAPSEVREQMPLRKNIVATSVYNLDVVEFQLEKAAQVTYANEAFMSAQVAVTPEQPYTPPASLITPERQPQPVVPELPPEALNIAAQAQSAVAGTTSIDLEDGEGVIALDEAAQNDQKVNALLEEIYKLHDDEGTSNAIAA